MVCSMSMTANQPDREFEVTGSFYKLENGQVTRLFGNVGISNGIAWNADETRMYHIDTTAQAVYAFDFDAENGTVSNRRKIIEIDISEGSPDGMCIDARGCCGGAFRWLEDFQMEHGNGRPANGDSAPLRAGNLLYVWRAGARRAVYYDCIHRTVRGGTGETAACRYNVCCEARGRRRGRKPVPVEVI